MQKKKKRWSSLIQYGINLALEWHNFFVLTVKAMNSTHSPAHMKLKREYGDYLAVRIHALREQICVCVGPIFDRVCIGDRYCFVGFFFFFTLSLFLLFYHTIIAPKSCVSRHVHQEIRWLCIKWYCVVSNKCWALDWDSGYEPIFNVLFFSLYLSLVLSMDVYRNFTCISKVHDFSNSKGPKLIKLDFYTQYTHF